VLDELGDDAVIISGGTELLLVMKLGFADYPHLVDVKRIAELRRLEASRDLLEVGAAVTHRRRGRGGGRRSGRGCERLG
jgi:carbon-monoxide dehydrogenase medium subunit